MAYSISTLLTRNLHRRNSSFTRLRLPMTRVTAARVRRPRQLLKTTDLSGEEVAFQSGSGSASVLREHFAGTVGTSPVSYRRSFEVARGR
jgi:transcriptional regulator GlxA family with amidase domain